MLDARLRELADRADLIVRGYAFSRDGDFVRVFNLNDGFSAMILSPDGTMLETNMDEIQQALVLRIWERDAPYMTA